MDGTRYVGRYIFYVKGTSNVGGQRYNIIPHDVALSDAATAEQVRLQTEKEADKYQQSEHYLRTLSDFDKVESIHLSINVYKQESAYATSRDVEIPSKSNLMAKIAEIEKRQTKGAKKPAKQQDEAAWLAEADATEETGTFM